MFPEHLPGNGGYAAFGMIFEPGKWEGDHWIGGEVPIGMSKKTIGFPRVAMNCALCHTTPVRKPGEAKPTFYRRRARHNSSTLKLICAFCSSARMTTSSPPTTCSDR